MTRSRRRHSTGFGYKGVGNNQRVFNQSANKSFSSLKERLNKETHYHHQLNFLHKKLIKEDKETIKKKIRKAEKLRTQKALFVFILMAIPVGFFIRFLIVKLFSNF